MVIYSLSSYSSKDLILLLINNLLLIKISCSISLFESSIFIFLISTNFSPKEGDTKPVVFFIQIEPSSNISTFSVFCEISLLLSFTGLFSLNDLYLLTNISSSLRIFPSFLNKFSDFIYFFIVLIKLSSSNIGTIEIFLIQVFLYLFFLFNL